MACSLRRFLSHARISRINITASGSKGYLQSKAIIHSPATTVAQQIPGETRTKNLERIADELLDCWLPQTEVVEQVAFDIKLEKFDVAAKIKIIKEVRIFTDLGLKDAKELVEKAPVVLKKGVTKEEAGAIVDKLKELGATVALE